MIQFFAPEIETSPELSPEDSAHCGRVLRHKPGDHIFVVDGHGKRFECELTLVTPKKVEFRIIDSVELHRSWKSDIELYVAPTKKLDRIEWLVEKCVEIGVDRIVPVICDRSERRELKTERLEKIAVSAMKQSLKAKLPEICKPMTFKDIFTDDYSGQWMMGYCSESVERRSFVSVYDSARPLRILIGPEGDFSPQEVELALSKGVMPVTFGAERLRTETAALVAVESAHVLQELMNQAI